MKNQDINNELDWDKPDEKSVIQINMKIEYFNILRKLKGTRQTWFDFLCRPAIVEYKKQQVIK